jgi:hypothetical protein
LGKAASELGKVRRRLALSVSNSEYLEGISMPVEGFEILNSNLLRTVI